MNTELEMFEQKRDGTVKEMAELHKIFIRDSIFYFLYNFYLVMFVSLSVQHI